MAMSGTARYSTTPAPTGSPRPICPATNSLDNILIERSMRNTLIKYYFLDYYKRQGMGDSLSFSSQSTIVRADVLFNGFSSL